MFQRLYAPRDMKGDRIIQGVASTSTQSSNGQSLRAYGCHVKLPVPVLWRHQKGIQIGEVTALAKDDEAGVIEVRCEIYGSREAMEVWKEIEAGRALCFSVGPKLLPSSPGMMKFNEGRVYTDWALAEVSVCYKGANPDAWLEVVRNRAPCHVVRIDLPKKGVVRLDR